jgi:ribosomal-protein-serine acetyltransferase
MRAMTTQVRLPPRITDGDDLVVRLWTVEDADTLGTAIAESTDHLRPWMAWIANEPMSLDDRRTRISEWFDEWRSGGDATYGILVDGQVAGGTGLHHRGVHRTLEIGYWLHPDFVGRGLATRVSRALTTAGLAVNGIDAVEIHHALDNERSASVPRRLGYRRLPDIDGECAARWRIERAEWVSAPDQRS